MHRKPAKIPQVIGTGISNQSNKHYQKMVFGETGDQPVLLLHPMNGPSPATLQLAEIISSWDYQVHVPNLFVNSEITFGESEPIKGRSYIIKHPDWQPLKNCPHQNIVDDINRMALSIHLESKQDLIVIGNCMSGIFPLALIKEPYVQTAVLCQPATPIQNHFEFLFRWMPKSKKTALGLPSSSVTNSLQAMRKNKRKQLIGLHYTHDPVAPIERFVVLQDLVTEYGIPNQFKTFLLIPQKKSKETRWTDHELTCMKQSWLKPHSTIVNAEPEADRKWFLQKLRDAL